MSGDRPQFNMWLVHVWWQATGRIPGQVELFHKAMTYKLLALAKIASRRLHPF